MKKKYLISSILIIVILALIIGVTYAFFNYTRTGSESTLRTGRIYFSSSQNGTIELTNFFPITSTQVDSANLDTVTVAVIGDTTYVDGEEFLISIVDVNNTINNKKVPMNYIATYTTNNNGVIGSSSNDYWNAREDKDASIYLLNSIGPVKENTQVLVSYIDNGATGINGILTVKAYIDAERIAISDTYDSTESDNMGTTNHWIDGRVRFTADEWNSFSETPISFKLRVESNEGIWVQKPGTVESCEGCKFIYTINQYFYSANNSQSSPLSTLTTFANNNETLTDDYRSLNKDYFLGFKFDGSGNVTNAYACGILRENTNSEKPFCIEGSLADTYGGNSTTRTAIYNTNMAILNPLYGQYDSGTGIGCKDNSAALGCYGFVDGFSYSTGIVYTRDTDGRCYVGNSGNAYCM